MDLREQLRVLQAAKGDPARLSLATVDLAYPALTEAERADIKAALEAAAIPHWFDEAILAGLLGIPTSEGAARLARLQGLKVVEAFPARGPSAANVHEATRLALRKRMTADDPAGFLLASRRAADRFASDSTPTGRIEWVYHLLWSDSERGATELERLHRDWMRRGHPEDRYALAVALQEVLDSSSIQGRARLWATLVTVWSQVDRGNIAELADVAAGAVRLARDLRDLSAEGNAECLLGDMFEAQGKESEAFAAFVRSSRCSERLALRDPSNAEWQWSQAITQRRVGSMLRTQGKLRRASTAFAKSLSISERLVKLDPSNPGWERALAAVHSSLGTVLAAQGKGSEALVEFERFLEISRSLVARDPSNADWQRDVAVAHSHLGSVFESQNRLDKALDAFERSLGITRSLMGQDPVSPGLRHDVAVALGHVGRVLEAHRRVTEAHSVFAEALSISRRLAEQDPTNAEWQRELGVAYNRVGAVLETQEKLAEALEAFKSDLEISRRLVRRNPTNAEWQRGFAHARIRVAGVLFAQGRVHQGLRVLAWDLATGRLRPNHPRARRRRRDEGEHFISLLDDPEVARWLAERMPASARVAPDETRVSPGRGRGNRVES